MQYHLRMKPALLALVFLPLLFGCPSETEEAPPEPPPPEVETPEPEPAPPAPPVVDDDRPAGDDELLEPGESRLDVRATAGGVSVIYGGWLVCDGRFELSDSREADTVTIRVTDTNASTNRVAGVCATNLSHTVEGLTPGEYTFIFEPGTGYEALQQTFRVE